MLLKGDDTIVALPGGEVAVNPGGTPALATAGHRRRALGADRRAAGEGAGGLRGRLPGRAGARAAGAAAADRLGADHVMAGDVIDALPHGLTLHEMNRGLTPPDPR